MFNSIEKMPDVKKNVTKFNKKNIDSTIIYSENNYNGVKYDCNHKQNITDISVK
jgi:hypothetical protein